MTFVSKHISISVNAPPEKVHEFASNPENLPKWAGGLSSSIKKSGEEWIADSPMGPVKVKFTGKNNFGILDHDVILPTGVTAHNPMRVVKNDKGSEVIFTLYRLPEMTEEQFSNDAKLVEKDLKKLKQILEE